MKVLVKDSYLCEENGPGEIVWDARHMICVDFNGKIGIYTKEKHEIVYIPD